MVTEESYDVWTVGGRVNQQCEKNDVGRQQYKGNNLSELALCVRFTG
jgi:hypothetical protein